MNNVCVSIALLACISCISHGQLAPTSWTRIATGQVYADDYGWGPGSDSDSFSVSEPGLGTWSTSSSATCSFGTVSDNTASISQSSTISTSLLKSMGTLHNSHSQMASSAESDTASSYTFEVHFTLAAPTPVNIAFSAAESYTNWASTDYYECSMYLSGPGIEEMAGYWPGPALPQSYAYAGTLPAGSYHLLLTAGHWATSANDPAALDWKYTWDFEMNVVPGPGSAWVVGVLAIGRRRRACQ